MVGSSSSSGYFLCIEGGEGGGGGGGGEYGGEGVLQIGLGVEIMGQRQQRRWEERGGKGGWGREREGGRKRGREREEERGGRIISGAIGLH